MSPNASAPADFSPGTDTPNVADDFEGVRISPPPPGLTRGPLDVVGVFQLPFDKAETIDEHPHRALVFVLNSSVCAIVGAPFREMLFFPEDLRQLGPRVRGYFRVRLLPPTMALPDGEHWISVSLGEYLSNVVAFVGPERPEGAA